MTNFKQDVLAGLGLSLKKLSSKYFYDEAGDRLFQQIMHLEEYYLPRCEREIIQQHSTHIAALLNAGTGGQIDVVELGAGDGTKTVAFLAQLQAAGLCPTYIPLDISPNILAVNEQHVRAQVPGIAVMPLAGDYFQTYATLAERPGRKAVLFLGSNIGNFARQGAVDFLRHIREGLRPGDTLLVAFDLKKNPRTILRAYDDREGITRQFNLNLLSRINRELGADFDVAAFDHYPLYEPVSGTTYSYLVSLRQQDVRFPSGECFSFEQHELIHTEISKKYDLPEIEDLATAAGIQPRQHFTDAAGYYALSLFEV